MFSHVPDASKIALAALVSFCLEHDIAMIDCQQNTAHLASLGAREVPRKVFLEHIGYAQLEPSVKWCFSPLYWNQMLSA
jgi:leucyl/phenylalanyl-tRNA--protein transferase